jgi:hypothetical protein
MTALQRACTCVPTAHSYNFPVSQHLEPVHTGHALCSCVCAVALKQISQATRWFCSTGVTHQQQMSLHAAVCCMAVT